VDRGGTRGRDEIAGQRDIRQAPTAGPFSAATVTFGKAASLRIKGL
jgi:hypothetical protein